MVFREKFMFSCKEAEELRGWTSLLFWKMRWNKLIGIPSHPVLRHILPKAGAAKAPAKAQTLKNGYPWAPHLIPHLETGSNGVFPGGTVSHSTWEGSPELMEWSQRQVAHFELEEGGLMIQIQMLTLQVLLRSASFLASTWCFPANRILP